MRDINMSDVRAAWEAGFKLPRSCGGEEKDRQWRLFALENDRNREMLESVPGNPVNRRFDDAPQGDRKWVTVDDYRAQVDLLERQLREARALAEEYRRDFQGELDGAKSLRLKYGARDDETFFDLIERLAHEREAAEQQLTSERGLYHAVMREIGLHPDQWPKRIQGLTTAARQMANVRNYCCLKISTEPADEQWCKAVQATQLAVLALMDESPLTSGTAIGVAAKQGVS